MSEKKNVGTSTSSTSSKSEKVADLSEQESALYDRQIRLWGVNAQKRIRNGEILLIGMNGLGAEIAKNLILAGIKSITLLDHRKVNESDYYSNFLISKESLGKNRAMECVERAQKLNPMVTVSVDTQNISDKTEIFFCQFNVVIVIEETIETLIAIDTVCRKNRIKFLSGDVWGMFGYRFIDYNKHTYTMSVIKRKMDPDKIKFVDHVSSVKRDMSFPTFENVIKFNFSAEQQLKKLKRFGPSVYVLHTLYRFRDAIGRDPHYDTYETDKRELERIADNILPNKVPYNYFDDVFGQVAPTTAIVGGEISSEVIKALSGVDPPHLNFFFFDHVRCAGFIETAITPGCIVSQLIPPEMAAALAPLISPHPLPPPIPPLIPPQPPGTGTKK